MNVRWTELVYTRQCCSFTWTVSDWCVSRTQKYSREFVINAALSVNVGLYHLIYRRDKMDFSRQIVTKLPHYGMVNKLQN